MTVKGGDILEVIDLLIIGGGVSGMAAAIGAKQAGVNNVMLIEREDYLGGVVNQCIHNDFGEKFFGVCMTGTEYVQNLINDINALKINYKLNTMVLNIDENKLVTYVNPNEGIVKKQFKSIIISTGSREMYTGNMNIVNNKLTGVYTIGTAQRLVNLHGYLPGKKVVIVGTSERSIIIARRLILEGAEVKALIEDKSEIVCKREAAANIIEEFHIPVKLSSIILEVNGGERVENIKIGRIRNGIKGTGDDVETVDCDCVLLTVDLIPEMDLLKNLSIKISNKNGIYTEVSEQLDNLHQGIFVSGSIIHPCAYADDVTIEGLKVGKKAADYLYSKEYR